MIKFKYRYCKVHMAKYLSGDLSDVTRRRIARFIDESQDCYEEYLRQREITEQLQRNLPVFGRADSQRLDNIWVSLQSELAPAATGALPHPSYPASYPGNTPIGQSLFMALLAAILLLPLAIGFHTSVASIDLPPRPKLVDIERTPSTRSNASSAVLFSTQSSFSNQVPLLQNTPEARFLQ
ncbi:MAG: hypothetical protein OXT68_06905 [Chloroflexota bacterium]|nr:hypothetical protein [Chloroflexota bacterium]MDE2950479.1 hypothetical protein [Chloroflexota bacterium]